MWNWHHARPLNLGRRKRRSVDAARTPSEFDPSQTYSMMKITGPYQSDTASNSRLTVKVVSDHLGEKDLWFELPAKFRDYFCSDRVDGFLIGLLFPAMQHGEDIHVVGAVSETLLFNLNNYAIPLLRSFAPSSKRIRISADHTSNHTISGTGVGTGFSGGVDSFCTIYDRFELETSPGYKINSLLFLNVGSHGPWSETGNTTHAVRNFQQRYGQLQKFPEEVGLDYIPIDSNLHAFHPWGHQKTHTLTSVAAIMALQKHFSKYYYSSTGVDYSRVFSFADAYKDKDVGIYCETTLLPLLSTESTRLIADGYQYTRAQKVIHIAEYEPVRRYLNVCTSPLEGWRNCSQCPKCCRTQMTLDSIGKLNEFAGVFDVTRYRKVDSQYKRRQVCRAGYDPYADENVRIARENDISLPGYFESQFLCVAEDFARKWGRKVIPSGAIEYLKSRRA